MRCRDSEAGCRCQRPGFRHIPSAARRWGATDPQYRPLLENWKTNFFGWNAANFGWGADRIENILWRLRNDELEGVNPKVIVVLAGINNVGTDASKADVEDITKGLRAILEVCQSKAPGATVILTAIFPRNDNMAVIPAINQINQNIAQMADGKKIRYLNINNQIYGGSEGQKTIDCRPLVGWQMVKRWPRNLRFTKYDLRERRLSMDQIAGSETADGEVENTCTLLSNFSGLRPFRGELTQRTYAIARKSGIRPNI